MMTHGTPTHDTETRGRKLEVAKAVARQPTKTRRPSQTWNTSKWPYSCWKSHRQIAHTHIIKTRRGGKWESNANAGKGATPVARLRCCIVHITRTMAKLLAILQSFLILHHHPASDQPLPALAGKTKGYLPPESLSNRERLARLHAAGVSTPRLVPRFAKSPSP